MLQKWKKAISLVLGLALLIGVCSGMPAVRVDAASTSWNFKDSGFKDLGIVSSNVTVDGLSLLASSDKTMEVKADTQEVSGTTYTYCLATGGGGNTNYRAVKVPVSGNDTIKVTLKSTGSENRTLAIANSSGSQIGTINASSTASLGTYTYSGSAGYVYLYSLNSNINIYKIQVDSKDGGSGTDPTDGTIVTNFSDLVKAVQTAESAGGGKVYVKGSRIDCTAQLALSNQNSNVNVSIIGLKNSDGTYPVLDFTSFRSGYIGGSTNDSQVGVRITGNKYTIQNLIIEKAPDNGIQIKGDKAGNNKVENCILRYNNDSGMQISSGAYNNTIRFVYSYRNCDVYTLGGNADGFAPKLAAGSGNTFYGCYAWDNSDDGWDSYDKEDGLTYDLSYEECATWNNGNPDVFTGKYDFDNGRALDRNLLLVELIVAKDSNFASNYAKGTFSFPSGNYIATSAGTISPSSWAGNNYGGNPNGFKFGSVNSTSSCVRTVKNCLSFNHAKKGFDNNNSSCTAYFTNCVSFDNGYNYHIQPFTVKSSSNLVGFSGSSNDKLPSGVTVSTPSSSKQASIRNTVASTVNQIVNACDNNKIPGEVYFNIYN